MMCKINMEEVRVLNPSGTLVQRFVTPRNDVSEYLFEATSSSPAAAEDDLRKKISARNLIIRWSGFSFFEFTAREHSLVCAADIQFNKIGFSCFATFKFII